MFASSKGHVEIVNKLIKSGAKINCKQSFGYNAFIGACQYKREEVIELLLLQPNIDISGKYADKTGLQWLKSRDNIMYDRILQFMQHNNIQVKEEDI